MGSIEFKEDFNDFQRHWKDLSSLRAPQISLAGTEPREILRTFHDALVTKLKLDFLFTHFTIASTEAPLEVLSVAPDALIAKTPDEFVRTLKDQLGDQPLNWPQTASLEVEVQAASLCSIRLGTMSKFGVVVAGSRRPDFPNQSERMLLDVIANRAVIDLQQAISVDEHKQLAQRNATLIAENEQLKREIAKRKLTDEALQISQNAFSNIIDTIPTTLGRRALTATANS